MSRETSIDNFGLLIAYVLPGFTALWGVSLVTDQLGPWLFHPPTDQPTVGGFLYVTLASIIAGLTVSAVRWLVIDAVHHRTGLRPPPRDFARLGDNEGAFARIVADHYHYYKYYSNMIVALSVVFIARHVAEAARWPRLDGIDALLFAACGVFFAGSRDTLRKYYDRTGQLLRLDPRRDRSTHEPRHRNTKRGGQLVDVEK